MAFNGLAIIRYYLTLYNVILILFQLSIHNLYHFHSYLFGKFVTSNKLVIGSKSPDVMSNTKTELDFTQTCPFILTKDILEKTWVSFFLFFCYDLKYVSLFISLFNLLTSYINETHGLLHYLQQWGTERLISGGGGGGGLGLFPCGKLFFLSFCTTSSFRSKLKQFCFLKKQHLEIRKM